MKVDTDVGLNGGHSPDQRQSRARRLLGVTFVRMRVAEIGEHAVKSGKTTKVEKEER